jgi:uncharacterized damage-inducible protein DinB
MLAEAQALWEQFERVHNEIFHWSDGLSDDQLNWKPPAQDTNSIGNLISHILGLLQRRAEVEAQVRETLDNLTATDLNRVVATQNGEALAGKFLIYLISHISGHMGQVIMTRKLLDAQT